MISKHRNLVLVGFMGTGKTLVGRILAARLRRMFVDMDETIARRAGKSIPEVFEQDGEEAFRRMERDLVVELADRPGQVISAGGGVVLNPANLKSLSQTGEIVCLTAEESAILERVRGDRSRPLLADDPEAKVHELLQVRQPLYDALPLRVDTTGRSPEAVAEDVLRRIGDDEEEPTRPAQGVP